MPTQVGGPATGVKAGQQRNPTGHLGARRAKPLGLRFSPPAVPQTRSCRPQGPGPALPSPTQLHGLGGQRKRTETSWAPSKEACPWGRTVSECRGARSPALGPVNELHAPRQIHHVFTCTSPSHLLFWDISAFSETMHSAPPTCDFCGQQPGAGAWAGVEVGHNAYLSPFGGSPLLCAQLLRAD